jgi:hypothetical protein
MPNHVSTRCIVTGPEADVSAFRERMFTWDERSEAFVSMGFGNAPADLIASFDPKMMAKIREGGGHTRFDFEKLIPSPAIVRRVVESNTSEDGARLMLLRGEYSDPADTMGMMETKIKSLREDVGMPDAPIREVAAAILRKYPHYEAEGRLRLEAILETGYSGWYSWNIANWGTKGNAYSFQLLSDDPLEFSFQTAWSFPWPIFEALAREYLTLQFKCSTIEEMMDFGGEGCFNPGSGEQPFELYEFIEEPQRVGRRGKTRKKVAA